MYSIEFLFIFLSLYLFPRESHPNIGFRLIKKSATSLNCCLVAACIASAAAAADDVTIIADICSLLPLGNILRLKYITDVNEKNALEWEKREVNETRIIHDSRTPFE